MLRLIRCIYGCRCLTTVDDLKVVEARDDETFVSRFGLDCLSRCRYAVVEGEKELGLVFECAPYALVHLAAGLEEDAHILL